MTALSGKNSTTFVSRYFSLKTAIRKISSLLFILLGFIPLLFVLFTTLKKKEIRHRMENELAVRKLQTIVLPESDVIWMDKHEIWVNNSMFDIKTKNLENGFYTFTGLYDEEETILLEKEKNAGGKNNEQNKLLAQLFKCLPGFCNQHSEMQTPIPEHDCYNFLISPTPINQFREILTPPPQVC